MANGHSETATVLRAITQSAEKSSPRLSAGELSILSESRSLFLTTTLGLLLGGGFIGCQCQKKLCFDPPYQPGRIDLGSWSEGCRIRRGKALPSNCRAQN